MTTRLEAFPLAWPDGWPRTPPALRKSSAYKVSLGGARDDLMRQLALAGRNVILSTNIPLRRDGLPYADAREPADPGAAVYWDSRKGGPMSLACDSWRTVRENIRALGLAIESLRQLERCGASAILERAYSGFKRLPEAPDCWKVLGISGPGAPREAIKARYFELAQQHHPDHGGNAETMAAINAAYAEATGEAGK